MYLKEVVIENSGPLRWFNLKLSFTEANLPKPLILVGGNGSGKTNFLSLVVDALFEAAAVHYDNVLPSRGIGRAWFRVVGGRNITIGAAGAFSLLQFDDAGVSRLYREKAGQVDPVAASSRVPLAFAEQVNWTDNGAFKEFVIEDERSRNLFREGVYAYFPSSRAEVPHWLNREAVPKAEFDVEPHFSKRLRKPIYVERAIDQFKQWLMSIIADSRADISVQMVNGVPAIIPVGDTTENLLSQIALRICNNLLKAVLSDNEARFVWLGRKSPEKVAVACSGGLAFPSLDALSAGQSILLGMFGTILRYCDFSHENTNINPSSIEGICLIDEIDAHIHVELQYKILPKLIKIFPKIQFILTSHSPIFVLGMEKEFGPEGIQVIEMPSGIPVGAESYAEFGRALEALTATSVFTEKVMEETRKRGKPVVFVEGETDAPYLKRAAELLGKMKLLELCDIEWIGGKDKNGQGFHTGMDALNHTRSVLKANPNIANRHILLLYDNDSKAEEGNYEGFSTRNLPVNGKNSKIKAGIENLLSEDCIDEKFYQTKEKTKPNGDSTVSRTLRKADLCEFMCTNGTVEQFSQFSLALNIIENYIYDVSA